MTFHPLDIKKLTKETENYSGADIEALAREAAMNALRRDLKAKEVTKEDFEKALIRVKPSITADMFKKYQKAVEDLRKTEIEEKEKSRYIG
jgi:transitional endoplasmic reticulum ATPase